MKGSKLNGKFPPYLLGSQSVSSDPDKDRDIDDDSNKESKEEK